MFKIGDKLKCIDTNIQVSLDLILNEIVTVQDVIDKNYIFIYTTNSPNSARAVIGNLEKHFELVTEPTHIFQVGDIVQCTTDKYKMLDIYAIDTVHAIEKNGFIRLVKTKRYKYKEKYFNLCASNTEEEKPMDTIHNPFKFIKKKPPYRELWKTICSNYTTSINEFTPTQIRYSIFKHLGDSTTFEANRLDLDSTQNIKKLIQYLPNTSELEKYSTYILNPTQIPEPLYYLLLLNGNNSSTLNHLVDNEYDFSIDIDNIYKNIGHIQNKNYILDHFTEYISISTNTSVTTPISSKEDLEEHIFISILKGEKTIYPFIFTSVIINNWIDWDATCMSMPSLPKGTKVEIWTQNYNDNIPDAPNIDVYSRYTWKPAGKQTIIKYRIIPDTEEVPF